MAEALWKSKGYEAFSAGLNAVPGMPVSRNAVLALQTLQITAPRRGAVCVTYDLAKKYACIVGMTRRHTEALRRLDPDLCDRITDMPFDIPDPYGGGEETYLACMHRLRTALDVLEIMLRAEGGSP